MGQKSYRRRHEMSGNKNMSKNKIYVTKGFYPTQKETDGSVQMDFSEFKTQLKKAGNLFKYKEAYLVTYNLQFLQKPFFSYLALRLFSSKAFHKDKAGNLKKINTSEILRQFFILLSNKASLPFLLKSIRKEVAALRNLPARTFSQIDFTLSPAYLRTDLSFGISSGGSIGHISGVINSLQKFTGPPVFLTTDTIPGVDAKMEQHIILPDEKYQNFNEVPALNFNGRFFNESLAILEKRKIGFVYQRYSSNNFSGVKLAARLNIPFILEYNGSELWISKNWGKSLQYEALCGDIELLNLHFADLIVVVSEVLKEELVSRGIAPAKILINPNGVDPAKYNPNISGEEIKQKYKITTPHTAGFIGTFGPWHGVMEMGKAIIRFADEYPETASDVTFLLIGDGVLLPQLKEMISQHPVHKNVIFTGSVPQLQGPKYLGACSIFLSPHVKNPDGSKFFGSPTKLFEYMAMGKAIIASNLDQIGEILEDKKTAYLVEPGNIEELAEAIYAVVKNPGLCMELGANAHKALLKNYTWDSHVDKILKALKELLVLPN